MCVCVCISGRMGAIVFSSSHLIKRLTIRSPPLTQLLTYLLTYLPHQALDHPKSAVVLTGGERKRSRGASGDRRAAHAGSGERGRWDQATSSFGSANELEGGACGAICRRVGGGSLEGKELWVAAIPTEGDLPLAVRSGRPRQSSAVGRDNERSRTRLG